MKRGGKKKEVLNRDNGQILWIILVLTSYKTQKLKWMGIGLIKYLYHWKCRQQLQNINIPDPNKVRKKIQTLPVPVLLPLTDKSRVAQMRTNILLQRFRKSVSPSTGQALHSSSTHKNDTQNAIRTQSSGDETGPETLPRLTAQILIQDVACSSESVVILINLATILLYRLWNVLFWSTFQRAA